ncbi:peptidylprolyl isomerase [Candidatus Microgenomates bacterium]|nr:peptidylprolyl isomerase [Candidatus Microgenomates bacterium]
MGVSAKDILKDNKKIFLPLGALLLLVIMAFLFSDSDFGIFDSSFEGIDDSVKYTEAEYVIDSDTNYSAVIKTTYGDIEIDLFEDETPISVNNFVFLAENDFYDDLTFHKVIKDFIIQGGDPGADSTGDAGYLYSDIITGRKMEEYSVVMANAGNTDSNGSQFFIVCGDADTKSIDGEYTIFGEVVSGTAIVDSICNVSVNDNYKPINNVEIESVQIVEN